MTHHRSHHPSIPHPPRKTLHTHSQNPLTPRPDHFIHFDSYTTNTYDYNTAIHEIMTRSPAYTTEETWTFKRPLTQQNSNDCGVYSTFTAYVWLHYHEPMHFPWHLFATHSFTNSFRQFIAHSLWTGNAPHLRQLADLPLSTPSPSLPQTTNPRARYLRNAAAKGDTDLKYAHWTP